MKRFLVLLVLLALCGAAQGLSLTFQNPSDFAEFVTCTGYGAPGAYSCEWTQSNVGANSYVTVNAAMSPALVAGNGFITNLDPSPTTYAAATEYHPTAANMAVVSIALYDSGHNIMYQYLGSTPTAGVYYRYEVKMVGSAAKIYKDGALVATSGALASNPYYVGFGSTNAASTTTRHTGWDNIVYGDSENKNIFGAPEFGYFIQKNLINPASSGFSWPNGTVIPSSQFNMTTTWGFGDTNESRTVILQNFGTGQTYSSVVTSAGTMSGSTAWPIYDAIIASGAPQGYYVTTVLGTNEYSQPVAYRSTGASVTWNAATYSRGDSAQVAYTTDALYWLPLTYAYRIDILDATLGVVSTHPITTQNGFISTSFAETDSLGPYYAVLIATPLAGGSDAWLGVGSTELTGYLVFTGYVNNATSSGPIAVANVSISQGAVQYYKTTSVDGNYTTNVAFYSGSPTFFNITATGYKQYNRSFTPIEAKTIPLNFTLEPLTQSFTGTGLRGIVRDSTYGRPIPSVAVSITNATYGESYSSTTNNAGGYFADLSTGAAFVSGRLYNIQGTKSGYNASVVYQKVIV